MKSPFLSSEEFMNKIHRLITSPIVRIIITISLAGNSLAIILSGDVQAAGVLFGKPGGLTTGSCDTWENACELSYVLSSVAISGDEIWLQQGTYKPTNDSDREATFQLITGVSIYGGFDGTETDRAQRDTDASLTILSGNIGILASNSDNSYHVVTGADGALIDGITITGGNANSSSAPNDRGGGMTNTSSSPMLTNVIISNNSAYFFGGGIFNNASSPTLTDVIIENNSISFIGDGGGIFNENASNPELTRVTISNNTATRYGGGMYNAYSSPVLSEVIISSNDADPYGSGGGMYNLGGSPELDDVTFSNNRVRNISVASNANGGGMKNASSSPSLTNVTFASNASNYNGGGIHNSASSPNLTNVTFSGNSAGYKGGGMFNGSSSSPVLMNVTFNGNSSSFRGGGIAHDETSTSTLTNVILWGNTATSAGPEIDNPNDGSNPNPTLSYCVVQDQYNSCPSGCTCDNLIFSDPLLKPLTDNGGFTQTMALSIGSSAINAADPSNFPEDDQRGVSRPQGDRCDIGAFELDDLAAPILTSFKRHDPPTSPTSADTLVFRATFNEDVKNVDASDFTINGTTTATITDLNSVDASTYDITVSGGNLASFNGTVGINLSGSQDIQDLTGYDLPDGEPSTDETYVLDNSIISIIPNGGLLGQPGALEIIDGGSYQSHFTQLLVTFNTDAYNPEGNDDPDDVTNPANYQLITTGSDGVFTSIGCGQISADDVQIPTGPVTYDNNGNAGPFVAIVSINNSIPLPSGLYRLYICGSTSITNLAGDPLNNGVDISRDFLIMNPVSTLSAPATGFAANRITVLPAQTTSYSKLGDLWLEIPSMGISEPIVGIPIEDGGWDVSWLGSEIGWLSGSTFPTWTGNSVLTGHVYDSLGRPGPFLGIDRLRYGAQIIMHAWGGQYIYEVREVRQILPENTEAMLEHKELPWLTLVTCRGFDEATNSYAFRILVQAVQIDKK